MPRQVILRQITPHNYRRLNIHLPHLILHLESSESANHSPQKNPCQPKREGARHRIPAAIILHDHFAWIAVALALAVVAGDVLVAVSEDEDGCFEDFYGLFPHSTSTTINQL